MMIDKHQRYAFGIGVREVIDDSKKYFGHCRLELRQGRFQREDLS